MHSALFQPTHRVVDIISLSSLFPDLSFCSLSEGLKKDNSSLSVCYQCRDLRSLYSTPRILMRPLQVCEFFSACSPVPAFYLLPFSFPFWQPQCLSGFATSEWARASSVSLFARACRGETNAEAARQVRVHGWACKLQRRGPYSHTNVSAHLGGLFLSRAAEDRDTWTRVWFVFVQPLGVQDGAQNCSWCCLFCSSSSFAWAGWSVWLELLILWGVQFTSCLGVCVYIGQKQTTQPQKWLRPRRKK